MVFLVAFFTTNVVFGKTFNVKTPQEFQNALIEAASNNKDDVINVAEGTYNITSTLTYSTNNGDSGHKLTIQGAGADKTVFDGGGSVQIMNINTDANNNGGDSGGDVTIKGMAFENGNGGFGGGVLVDSFEGTITITNNTFSGNSVGYYGGGVIACSISGTVTITNNTFSGNSGNSASSGGGVNAYSFEGTVTITNNTFSGNFGGVIAGSDSGTVTITNNTFSGNSAGYGGGVLVDSFEGTITITNNTFSGNSVGYYGGGIYAWLYYDTAILNIYNNIFLNNTANDGDDLYVDSDGDGNHIGSTINLYNNDLSGNANFDTGQSEDLYITCTDKYNHANNIQHAPQFVDPINGDFHLKSTSPCIDAGTADAPELPDTDFEGNPRILGPAPDIGADEYYTGHPIPIPDIKINGSDGPIKLNQSDTLTITVTLNNTGQTNNADWWLAADTPFGLFFFTFEGWTTTWVPGYQSPLFYLDSFEVFSMPVSGLQAGTYTLYFGVDTVMDRNVTWDSAYYDTVVVNITE